MKKSVIAIVVSMVTIKLFAQNSDTTKTSPAPTIAGSVDVYYSV